MKHRGMVIFFLVILAASLAACASSGSTTAGEPAVKDMILATTTSTRDSGLLDVLVPEFEEGSGYVIKTVAVGTGKALQMGEEGNADVLLVHAPPSEIEFMDGGYGGERFLVMHNDFVFVGPPGDPAGIKGKASAADALAEIAGAGATFASRGDDSGTNKKELSLWEDAGMSPSGDWYLETGQGMGATLQIASEKGAYTMTDRATYLANSDNLELDILVEGDPTLLNVYHAMTVNPEMFPKVNKEGAMAFAQFLISPETQAMIGEYGVEKFGQPLFFPDADKIEADLGLE